MIVKIMRRDGDNLVAERAAAPVMFQGGAAQEGVLITFPLEDREVTARIVKVWPDDADGEPVIEVELIDQERLDVESRSTLADLPPKDEFTTDI
jgi:hypothetical protein